MDILITIAFLALYYILGLGTVITLKTGLEEDVELEGADYLLAAGFPILLFVVFLDWIIRKLWRRYRYERDFKAQTQRKGNETGSG